MNRLKRVKAVLLSALMAMCILTSTFAADAAVEQNEKRVVKVAYPKQKYLTEIDENGNYYGYSYDYLNKIAEFANWKLEYVTYPNMDLNEQIMGSLNSIETGEADLLGVMLRSEELEEKYLYPEENYGVVYTTLEVLESNFKVTETNYMKLSPLRVAVLTTAKTRNSEFESFAQATQLNYELVYCESVDEQIAALKNGMADAMLKVSLTFLPEVREIVQFAPRPYYFVTAKGNEALMQELDEAIQKIHTTDPYFDSRLRSKYFINTMADFSLSNEEKEYVEKNKNQNVLIIPEYAPFAFLNHDGELCGMSVTILNDISEKSNIIYNYHILKKGEDINEQISTGKYDIVVGPPSSITFAEENGLVLSQPYLDESVTMFINRNSQNKEKSQCTLALVEDVSDVIGYEYKEIIYYDNIQQCLEAVNNGEADYGYGNRYSIDFYTSQNSHTNLKYLFLSGYNREVGFYVPNTEECDLLSIINKYVRSMPTKVIHGHLSLALSEKDYGGIERFIHDNPILVIVISVTFLFLLLSIIMLLVFNSMNKKRNKKLQIAFSAKSDFLSRMSHDMRTPMNGIIGLTGLSQDIPNLPKEVTDNLSKINDSAKYLLNLINDTLDMNKIESNKIVLNKEPTNLGDFFEQMMSVVKVNADQKKVNMIAGKSADGFPLVYMDKVRVQQIFFNLISNAIKFTPENGTVEVMGECHMNGTAQVATKMTIKDTGIGIDANFLSKIFEPFEQECTSATANYGGTGLGLAIVKNLVDIMGGTISVKSEKGVGSEFAVSIVFDVADVQEEQKTDSIVSNDVLKGKRVLLCEDHPLNAQIATKLLEKKGMVVEYAENGQAAVELFNKSNIGYYRVILMDIRMPVMDGLSATKIIRQSDRADAKQVPIIAMTANAFDEDVKKSLEAGMSAHLAKPIEPEKLYETIRKFI